MWTLEVWRKLRREGTIERGPYLLIGLVLTPIKYSIDSIVAARVFGQVWMPWDYLISGSTLVTLVRVTEDRAFFLTLLGLSIPFLIIGIVLTLARLRSAGLSPWLVILFFAPVLNLLLMLMLVLWPPQLPEAAIAAMPVDRTRPGPTLEYGRDLTSAGKGIRRFAPKTFHSSFWMAGLISALMMWVLTFLSVEMLASYGWGVFVGIPFVGGMLAAVLHSLGGWRTARQCIGVAAWAGLLATMGFFILGIEGAVCLIMFLPLGIPLAMFGGVVGYGLQLTPRQPTGAQTVIIALILFMPLFLGTEKLAHPAAPIFAVTSAVDIDAPPDRVWQNVIAFTEIPRPTEWLFRAGVAYPLRARITGAGVGAIRHCEFSTGAFIEPITAWDAPNLLKFDVVSNPPAMREWSPYNIHPPHVHDFLISHGGQFQLIPLGNGRTRLKGTTWYEHNLWPASYWRLWSDYIIHRIHLRVLEHVKRLSEQVR